MNLSKRMWCKWTDVREKAFNLLKDKVTNAPLLCLPNFDKDFENKCDASAVGIGVVLIKHKRQCFQIW